MEENMLLSENHSLKKHFQQFYIVKISVCNDMTCYTCKHVPCITIYGWQGVKHLSNKYLTFDLCISIV